MKICVICGAEFEPRPHNRSVCYNDHHHPCPVCGKDVVCNDPKRQECACSRQCGSQLANATRMNTALERYGVTNVSRVEDVRKKISENLKAAKPKQPTRYKSCEICGAEFELQWPYTQHTCSPKCRGEYRKRTGISREVYDKAAQTNLSRYGVTNPGERPEVHKKMEDTMEVRYGVRYARYLPEIEAKVRQTCMERYGVSYYIQTEDANRNNIMRISELNRRFQAACEAVGCQVELEKYVNGKFFDLCIDNKTVVEIDPTYTHNAIGNHWTSEGTPPRYHINKTKLAQDNGYRCIHVWDWDNWDKVIELLRPTQSIGARKCEIREVSQKAANAFTAEYHINGSCNGQICNYGLYFEDELVELMSFGRPRYNRRYDWELLRLCTRAQIRVPGGASKLFNYFIQLNQGSIISYCDLSKFSGTVYSKIGMKLVNITSPNKIWSRGDKKITQNLLNQRGYDQLFGTDFGKGTSNEQLMLDNGWLPVYDCGQLVFEYVPGTRA